MLFIHRYIFLYADDFYYSRDASYGLSHLPRFILSEFKSNGRVWIGLTMLGVLKYDVHLFRIVNPLLITLTVLLIAKISTYSEQKYSNFASKRSAIAFLCVSLFFLMLPIKIAHTTIYYAACAFNYLYPTALVLLFAYLLYTSYADNKKPSLRARLLLILLSFLAGAATQQAGMIAIGYIVMITLYLEYCKRIRVIKHFIPYYLTLAIGFSMILYGSFHRLLYEQQAGKEVNLLETLSGLLTINIFSQPASVFVLLICLSSIYWLHHFTASLQQGLSKVSVFIMKSLLLALPFAVIGYIYVVLYRGYQVQLLLGRPLDTLLIIAVVVFTVVYIVSILLSSWLIMRNEHYPFLLFGSINAIGVQLILLFVDARFAHAYKIMFPSLLLMSIYIAYSVLKFHTRKFFLILIATAFFLSLYDQINFLALSVTFIFGLLILTRFKLFNRGMVALFMAMVLLAFSLTVIGYREVAMPQAYNLQAIKEYQQTPNKDVLKLKNVPVNYYGYNLNNWNNLPYFLKECYRIKAETTIEYIQ